MEIGSLETKLCEIQIKTSNYLFKKFDRKIVSAKRRPYFFWISVTTITDQNVFAIWSYVCFCWMVQSNPFEYHNAFQIT